MDDVSFLKSGKSFFLANLTIKREVAAGRSISLDI